MSALCAHRGANQPLRGLRKTRLIDNGAMRLTVNGPKRLVVNPLSLPAYPLFLVPIFQELTLASVN